MTGAAAAEFKMTATARVGLMTTEGTAAVGATTTYKAITADQVASLDATNAATMLLLDGTATGAIPTLTATTAANMTADLYAAAVAVLDLADSELAASRALVANNNTAALQTSGALEQATLDAIRAAIAPTTTAAVDVTEDDTAAANRMRVSFTGSGETDTGIAFGATIRADNSGVGASGTGGSQYVSGAFGKVKMGDLGGADKDAAGHLAGVGLTGLGDHNEIAYQAATHNIGYEYSMSGITFGYSQNTAVNSGGNSAMGLQYSGDLGGATVTIGLGQSKLGTATQSTMSAAVSSGGLTIKALTSSNDNGTTALVAERAALGAVTYRAGVVAANNADLDSAGVSISYAMDAMSVTAFSMTESTAGEVDADFTGLGFAYDMGGVALKAGVVDNNDQQIIDFGLSFSF
jgi:outer membrane protein OmpU